MIGIIWISLFEASNSVMAKGLVQVDKKMIEVIDDNSCLDMYVGRKWHICTLTRN